MTLSAGRVGGVLGLDLSLTSTGVALPDGETGLLRPKCTGAERLDWFARELHTLTAFRDLVVLEGYSFASRNSQAHAAGELGGLVRLICWRQHTPLAVVSPKARAKYATGNGAASKDAVFAAAIRRLGYEGTSNDEADALWLRAMGLDHLGEPVVVMPAVNREALTRVEWP